MSRPHIPVRTIDAADQLPEPPSYFDNDRKKKYYKLGKEVLGMKIIEPSDFDAFCILVDNLVGYENSAALLIKEGQMVSGREGTMVKHPASSMKNTAFQIIQPLLVQFALTPSSRAAMNIVKDTVSVVDEFLPQQ